MTNLFQDSFTGSNGAAWSASWTTTNVSSLNTSGATQQIQGNKGRLNAGTVASYGGHSVIRYSGSNVSDIEWIGKITFTTSIDGNFEAWARASTSSPDGTGYIFQLNLGTTNTVTVIRANSFTYTTLGQASVTLSQNTEYGWKFYVVGTSIKAKVWATSGSEPGSYNLNLTDSAVTAAGYSYVHAHGGGSSGFIVDLDDITLTNGQSNQFTYTGQCQPGPGVFSRGTVTKNPFTGSVTATGAWSYIKVVTRTFTAAITGTGAFLKQGQKIFTGASQPSSNVYKMIPKTLAGSITATGVFRKAFVRKFTGTIATVGTVAANFAGRVFGRPGIVKVTVEKAGAVRMRARRG